MIAINPNLSVREVERAEECDRYRLVGRNYCAAAGIIVDTIFDGSRVDAGRLPFVTYMYCAAVPGPLPGDEVAEYMGAAAALVGQLRAVHAVERAAAARWGKGGAAS